MDQVGIRSGQWHAWAYETQLEQVTCEGVIGSGNSGPCPSPAVGKTTKYAYDYANYQAPTPDGSGGQRVDQYGNVTKTSEYAEAPAGQIGALLRTTEHWFNSVNDNAVGGYIVDRPWQEAIRDGQGHLLALTTMLYDGHAAPGLAVGDRGDLTLARKYFDVPQVADQPNGTTWHGSDTAYGYDVYGNRTTVTTYTTAGERTRDAGGAVSYGAPGGGSAGRTVATAYDPTFHAFPTLVTQPTVTADGTPLTMAEGADYDYRMGTLTSVTDANGQQTTAGYDAYGRMVTLVKPGDSAQYPTNNIYYYDAELPVRYVMTQRLLAGGNVRPVSRFYDGLGRAIQVQKGSAAISGGTQQSIVTDARYDGLGRVAAESQARYATPTAYNSAPGSTFYIAPPSTGLYWTATSYDGAGRTLDVTMPDSTVTRTRYFTAGVGMAASVTDANGHKTRRESDLYGRLRAVLEYSGTTDGGSDPYTLYATTMYAYDGRDLLTGATDAAGNITAITYDSLGRKIGMADPDMGAWSYSYDPTGTLHTQTDAKGQTITFAYDALDRLTGKAYSTGQVAAQYRYDEAAGNGRGRRTSMSNGASATNWRYDPRGNAARTEQTVAGISGSLVTSSTYTSADVAATTTYPGNGTIAYTYDFMLRQIGITDPVADPNRNVVIGSATYDALDQPLRITFPDSDQPGHPSVVLQAWTYAAPMQRVEHIAGNATANVDKRYTYDNVGNVTSIHDGSARPDDAMQIYTYDHRDRLVQAGPQQPASHPTFGTEGYAYDALGNFTSKAGVAYAGYGAGGAGTRTPRRRSAGRRTPTTRTATSPQGAGGATPGTRRTSPPSSGRRPTATTRTTIASCARTTGRRPCISGASGSRMSRRVRTARRAGASRMRSRAASSRSGPSAARARRRNYRSTCSATISGASAR